MITRFKDLHDAVNQACYFTNQWIDDNLNQYDPYTLTQMLEVGENESGVDILNDEMAYYLVDDFGALGLTYDGEQTVYWIVRPAVIPQNIQPGSNIPSMPQSNPQLVGFSQKLNMREFQDALHKSNRNKTGCAVIFIIAPVILVPIYTYFSDDAAFTGLLIGAFVSLVFLIFWIIFSLKTKTEKPWEGQVIDKYIKEKYDYNDERRDGNNYHIDYHQYVIIQSADGKKHKIHQIAGDRSHAYNYFNIGDRVRFLAGTDLPFPYEKYDKSHDQYQICPFCNRRINDMTAEYCPKCNNPLLR